MNGNRIGRTALALTAALALGVGMTACSRDYTVAYVYAGSSNTGTITAFGIDYQTGTLNQLDGSPFAPPNGNNIVAMVAAPNSKAIYALERQISLVQPYQVGTDGKLYAVAGKNTTGSFPVAAAIDPAGKFLYVLFTYQNGFTLSNAGPGGINIYPINADASLGTPTTVNVGNNPVGIVVSPLNNFVYVVDAETINGAATGEVLGFAENTSTGALTPLKTTTTAVDARGNTILVGVVAGSIPTAIAEEPKAGTVYVTDSQNNNVVAFGVQGSNASVPGSLVALQGSPYPTQQFPTGIVVDPRGKYLYVTNLNANSISAFQISQVTSLGTLTSIAGSGAVQTGTQPVGISIEPALGKYMFTADRVSNQLSGLQLNPDTGALTNIQNTPFDVGSQPLSVVTVANGTHATQLINP